jgi:hypothetical protein
MHSLRTYLLQALADPAARDAACPEALVGAPAGPPVRRRWGQDFSFGRQTVPDGPPTGLCRHERPRHPADLPCSHSLPGSDRWCHPGYWHSTHPGTERLVKGPGLWMWRRTTDTAAAPGAARPGRERRVNFRHRVEQFRSWVRMTGVMPVAVVLAGTARTSGRLTCADRSRHCWYAERC